MERGDESGRRGTVSARRIPRDRPARRPGERARYSQRLQAITEPERELPLREAVACPLDAGGATVHSDGTSHFTDGNLSADRRRRAYIFSFRRPS